MIICRKLVLLKLEKGYEFGDVLLDGSMPNHHSNTVDSEGNILSTSMFTPVKDNLQRVCVVAKEDIIKKYQEFASTNLSKSDEGHKNNSKNKNDEVKNNSQLDKVKNESDPIGNEITFDKADTKKEILSKACSHCFNNNLTICHLDFTTNVAKLSKNIEDGKGKETADFTNKPFYPDDRCAQKDDNIEEKKLVKKVRKMTKRLWSHTSKNGLFITVWPGTKTHNAFVGIAVNKGSV